MFIDLHTHILPGIDDGSADLEMSFEMARVAVAEGTRYLACTPHITPGIYENRSADIRLRVRELQSALDKADIGLKLVAGADIHIAPDLIERLSSDQYPRIGTSRYFLFEPAHHVLPPNTVRYCEALLDAGYRPILTHPERLTWIEKHYDVITALDELGLVIQLTAASVTGRFGARALYWSERMLDEGRVDIVASDAHDPVRRPPRLVSAFEKVSSRLGEAAGKQMFWDNPKAILLDQDLDHKTRRIELAPKTNRHPPGFGFFRK